MTPAQKSTIVAVTAEGKDTPLAIGITSMSTEEIATKNKGIGVENYHYLNDGLWNMKSRDINQKIGGNVFLRPYHEQHTMYDEVLLTLRTEKNNTTELLKQIYIDFIFTHAHMSTTWVEDIDVNNGKNEMFQRWNPNTNLRLSFFSSTGRGLMALSPIESNSLIIRVPYEFVITRSKAQCQTNDTRTTHDVLAQFLTQESALREASKWFFYIKSLPKPVLEQKREAKKTALTNAWAYFTVNTRAVYHSDGGMALIPFLDMFNHSPHVSVSINEARDGSFEIISVNIKLFLEYGFWIANNPHDAIPITLSELTSVLLEGKDNKIDQNMCLAMTSSKIHETKEESASLASPSWNIYACFDILKRDDASSLYRSTGIKSIEALSRMPSSTKGWDANFNFKIVLLGEGCVGKTSCVLRYVDDQFNERHITTLQASFLNKRLNVRGGKE
ncbi:unnamed protein product [Lepeophtheirus salmonis]|uniref:(salmon louse) hypothetical protein n=1 Tax=Lepeophtheirus salmonis TaxID=72036 RepID=A0A7R8CRM7_LEPSM|nr:unnamed protein product [Lepeophtheirus salmonis]CAF2907081.1 unnamed protein product [Lepeophtheirus salmonis]